MLALVVSYHTLGPRDQIQTTLPIKPLVPGHLIYFFYLAPAVQLVRKVSECVLTGQTRITYLSWGQSMWLGDYNIQINQSLSGLSRACYWRMCENEGRSGRYPFPLFYKCSASWDPVCDLCWGGFAVGRTYLCLAVRCVRVASTTEPLTLSLRKIPMPVTPSWSLQMASPRLCWPPSVGEPWSRCRPRKTRRMKRQPASYQT